MTGRGRFAPTEIGYVHIDSCELRLSDLDRLEAHVLAFVCAYNSAKRLNALRW